MRSGSLSIRPVTWWDIPAPLDCYDADFDPIGYVCERDGEAVGIGAILMGAAGGSWGVVGLYDEGVRNHPQLPIMLHRPAVRTLKRAVAAGIGPVLTVVEPENSYSLYWMMRIGFKPTGDVRNDMEIWSY